MYNHAVHKTVLLQSLIALLHDEGIEVNNAAALSIEKILFHTDLDVYDTLSKLKFRIVPILSRNKEEQEIIYKIFDKLDEKIKTEASDIQPPDTKENSFVVSKAETPSVKWTDQLRRLTKTPRFWIGLVLLTGLVAFIVIRSISSQVSSTQEFSAQITADKTEVIVNDTVHFTVQSSDTTTKKYTSIRWMFSDTSKIIFQDTVEFTAQTVGSKNDSAGEREYSIAKIFRQPGDYLVKALLKEPDSKREDTISYSVPVLCEPTPSVAIDRVALPSAKGPTSLRNNSYIPRFTNPSKDSAEYKYHWFVNDELLSSGKVLNYKSKAIGSNKIILVVDCKGIHCSADSLVYTLDEQPPIRVSVAGDGKLQMYKTYDWTNILITLFSLLAVAIVPGILVYRLLKPVQKKKTEEEPPELQEPYSIRFNSQEHTIQTQKEIDQLADILRKRHVSDIYKLSIRKTIQSTVRSGGLPALAFVPLTKPSDYLVFVETNNEDSHLERLFKYLIAKLENEQVYLTVYEYRKEPLYLSNEKMNHIRIPVDKVASLYPDRTLLIFGDTKNFILPLKNTLKKWVTEKLNTWSTKIIITPFPKNDWDKKEQLLIEAMFTIIPADLNANSIIEKIINGNIETQSEASFSIPATYTARSYNFNEFDSMKEYLGNENLLKWVCSLAVYPSIDWNLTIAIGKKLENELAKKGQPVELVNYSNLLKISRISWLQDGILTDTLRIEMLGYLDNETEMLARQTLVEQLTAIENEVSAGSMIKRQFDVHQKMNSFLLNAYENKKPSKNDEAFIKEILSESQMDEAHEIYLNNSNNTLLKDPFKKGRSVNFKRYFKATALRRKLIAFATVLLTVITLAVTLSIITGSGPWMITLPSNLQFVIRKGNVTVENFKTSIQLEDIQQINLSAGKDSVAEAAINIYDTSAVALLTISSGTGQLLARDSFKLNSKIYTVQLTESTPIPLQIFYKNASDLALANAVQESLPTNFDVTIGQQNFKDTAVIITYSSGKQKKDADLLNTIVSKILTRNVKVVKTGYSTPANIKNGDITFKDLPVAIYITSAETCTPLTAAGLPKILSGNWHGGVNNRNTEIDLTRNLIKYSTGDVNSFGLYSINEVCLRKNNVYRLITKTDKGYKPFYVTNISAQSFDWSICQFFYKTKAEIIEMDESSCGTFNTMKRLMINDTTKRYSSTKVKDSSKASNTSTTFTPALRDEYQKLYDRCELYQPRVYEVDEIILNMTNNKARYDSVAKVTGVPWYFIAILHYANCGQDFSKHLLNGDPLTARTFQVPRGRPVKGNPPFTWEESAVDALTFEGITNNRDWSISAMLYLFEKDNGMGYRKRGINSPFLWGGSNLYTAGKFLNDGSFYRDVVSKQMGAGVLLKVMDQKGLFKSNLTPVQKKLN